MEKKMTWSSYQKKIFDFVEHGTGSAVINAAAGSGKTTTSVEAASRLDSSKKVLFLAFNKSIVDELKMRLTSPNILCSTLHGYGLRCLRLSGLVTSTTKIEEDKWRKYFRENLNRLNGHIFKDEKSQDFRSELDKCCDLFNMCRIFCMSKQDDIKKIEEIDKRFGIMASTETQQVVNDVLSVAYILKPGQPIDFIDMICLPVMNANVKIYCPTYDFVFIDEAQDLSMAQQELMKLAIKQGGRFLAVGDPRQAINGFAGALNDSFDRLKKIAGGKELPLSVNYRCPKNIIDLAKEIVPSIRAHRGAKNGGNEHIKDLSSAEPGDMIICRKSAPLITLALKFVTSGKRAFIKGTELGASLKKYAMKAVELGDTRDILMTVLSKEQEAIKKKIDSGKATEKAMVNFEEKWYAIIALMEGLTRPSQMIPRIDLLFNDTDSEDAIKLSTVHRAKGLEANNVFVMCPECLPLEWNGQQDWEKEQEMNLKYVAITRARKNLYWVDIPAVDINKCDVM